MLTKSSRAAASSARAFSCSARHAQLGGNAVLAGIGVFEDILKFLKGPGHLGHSGLREGESPHARHPAAPAHGGRLRDILKRRQHALNLGQQNIPLLVGGVELHSDVVQGDIAERALHLVYVVSAVLQRRLRRTLKTGYNPSGGNARAARGAAVLTDGGVLCR